MLIDPRHGDIEDDAASPGQRSLLAIAGSLLVEISLPKLLFAWTVLLLLPAVLLGLAPLLASAWFSKLSDTACRTDRDRHGARFDRDRRAGMDRMAAAVSDCRDQFLVAQRARRAARLRVRPRSAASPDGTDMGQEPDPRRPGAIAQRQFGRSGHHAVDMRGADRDCGLACLALDRQLERPGLAASPRRADARQCRRAAVGISGGRIADLGICGCQHAATRRSRRVRYRFLRGP